VVCPGKGEINVKKLIGWQGIVGLGIGAGLSFPGFAQTYPAQPIRLIVGFQAGGATDIAARAIGKKLTESLGQSVIVDNRPGAAGNIAADIVAKAPPDGYALLMANATIAIPSLYAKLPFDVNKDLLPISLIAMGPSLLVVNPSLPVNNVRDLIAMAKAKPNHLLYGSGGLGNSTHLAMELFTSMAVIEMVHVPYKGGAPSVIGLMSGEVQILFTSIPSVLAQVNAGKVKALGVSTLHRSSALPNVPTIDEAGLTGYSAASWYGLFAPAGVPQNALAILSREIVKIMRVQEIRERFLSDGFEPVGNDPEEFSRFIQEEIPKWAKVVKMAGIKPQ
jgi:tripartite-type tricarboxylate transporter receptor subunit TctC